MAEKDSLVVTSFDPGDVDVVFQNDTSAIMTYRVQQVGESRDRVKGMTQEMMDSTPRERQPARAGVVSASANCETGR